MIDLIIFNCLMMLFSSFTVSTFIIPCIVIVPFSLFVYPKSEIPLHLLSRCNSSILYSAPLNAGISKSPDIIDETSDDIFDTVCVLLS